jgi:hypothetical protein
VVVTVRRGVISLRGFDRARWGSGVAVTVRPGGRRVTLLVASLLLGCLVGLLLNGTRCSPVVVAAACASPNESRSIAVQVPLANHFGGEQIGAEWRQSRVGVS